MLKLMVNTYRKSNLLRVEWYILCIVEPLRPKFSEYGRRDHTKAAELPGRHLSAGHVSKVVNENRIISIVAPCTV